jgi:hypothetical protein
MAWGDITYQATTRREDLMDFIADVSPDDNPLSTLFGRSKASGTYHEWTEDYISRPTAISKAVEGADATFSDLTNPSRRGNTCHIISKTYRVSGTLDAVDVAGMGSMLDYQATKAAREWKNELEYAVIQGSTASGDSGVAREMAGIEAIVTSHYTNRLSGTSLSETELNNMVYDVANDVGMEDVFDMLVLPLQLRQKVSTFTAGATKFVDATDKRLTRPVAVYESDFNVMRVFAHKDVTNAVATPGPMILGLKEDKWKIAYLRPPRREALAKTGDSEKGQIIGEQTLEYLAERCNTRRSGYNQTG